MADFYEYDNQHLPYTKAGNFVEQLPNYQLFKEILSIKKVLILRDKYCLALLAGSLILIAFTQTNISDGQHNHINSRREVTNDNYQIR
jgi:hypothetical protein